MESDAAAMARVRRAYAAAYERENMIATRVILGLVCVVAAAPVTLLVLLELGLGLPSSVFGELFVDSSLSSEVLFGTMLAAAVVLGVGGIALAVLSVRLGPRWWQAFWGVVGTYVSMLVVAAVLVAST